MVLRSVILVTILAVLLSTFTSGAEGAEIRLISPIGAATRSIIPGWGQVYTHDRLGGVIIFLSVGILGAGGVQADAKYRDLYNNKYKPAVLSDSSQADSYFDRSNQYYKLSRFLLYAAAGIWAYSVMDAYVDAHFYNARQQVKMLDINDAGLKELKLETGLNGVGASSIFAPEQGDHKDLYYLSSFQKHIMR